MVNETRKTLYQAVGGQWSGVFKHGDDSAGQEVGAVNDTHQSYESMN